MKCPPGGGSSSPASLRTARTVRALGALALASLSLALVTSGCKKKISQSQCDEVLEHFAELVVKERFADAGPEAIAAERVRERQEAKNADEFKNCTTEVQANEHDCAMKAQTSDALIKCLE
ncbi:MAG: hypothetical protein K0S65_1948 [Labilithrix sp.]|nr:hypothetical protein [Labilithrix sp.]